MNFIIRLLLVIAVVGTTFGCSTTKKRGEVSALGKFWHDTNARFNGYYNANLIINESILALDAQHTDNYTTILPVFPHIAAENPQAEAPNLDIVIEKSTINIVLHEPSNWTDDSYLLIGQSQYLKQDYETAEETLEFTIKSFSPDALAKRKNDRKAAKLKKKKKKKKKRKKPKKRKRRKKINKKKYSRQKAKERKEAERKKALGLDDKRVKLNKKEEKPKKNNGEATAYDYTGAAQGGIKHKPAYQETLLWLARTYIERDNYSGADYYLRQLESNGFLLNDVAEMLPAVRSHLYLSRGELQESIPHLEAAIEKSSDNNKKGRYAFILAQVQEKLENYSESEAAYQSADKYSNTYNMEFHAKLKRVELAWRSGQLGADNALKQLERMTKDEKNTEYIGEIYFTMAKIAMANGDAQLAMEYYRKALSPDAQTNPAIKAEIYYELASLYYEKESYVEAKAYYDSTMNVMTQSDERYKLVSDRSKNLIEIAELMEFIGLQDSLLGIANMSEKERRSLASRINQAEKEKEKQAEEAANANNQPANVRTSRPLPLSNTSTWVFYNRKKVEKGVRSFKNRWGNRPLEDNWRRSERSDAGQDVATVDPNSNFGGRNKDEDVEFDGDYSEIFKDVPFEASEQSVIRGQLDSAIFTLGTMLRDRLENYDKAIEVLNSHLKEYPESEFNVQTHFYLYLSHRSNGDDVKSSYHANKVCEKYAQSIYCRLINDPESVAAEVDSRKQAERYYEKVFETFSNRNYEQVLTMVQQVVGKFGTDTGLEPKFALISAMSKGHINGKDAYLTSLREVAGTYRGTPEATRAKEIMRLLGSSLPVADEKAPGADKTMANIKFVAEDEQQHYGLFILKDDKLKDQDARIAFADYHNEFYKLDNLKVSSMALRNSNIDQNQRMLVIRRFDNHEDIKRYYDAFAKNSAKYFPDKSAYDLIYISRNNYRTILKEQRLDEYYTFFDENYRN